MARRKIIVTFKDTKVNLIFVIMHSQGKSLWVHFLMIANVTFKETTLERIFVIIMAQKENTLKII